ncbi:flagellin [Parapedomonas caeni]
MIGRIASFSHTSYLLTLSMGTQTRLAQAQEQQASGLISQSYAGIARDTAALLDLNGKVSAAQADAQTAETTAGTMEIMYSTLNNIVDLASEIQSQLAAALDSTTTNIANSAEQWLTDLASMLNTTYAGRYLFAGTATDAMPVDISAYDPASATTADTSYYQGAEASLRYTGSDGYTVSYGATADDAAFEQIFRALSMVIDAPDDASVRQAAYDLMDSAIDRLGQLQQTLSTKTSALNTYMGQRSAIAEDLATLASDLKDTDLAAATVMVTQYQTQLEASYSSISKLLSTNLLDYLR